jgi:hypothetical protein
MAKRLKRLTHYAPKILMTRLTPAACGAKRDQWNDVCIIKSEVTCDDCRRKLKEKK